ncbi:uncharacterized protein LOC130457269 [Monodelphis domestica]|uniref:uncharacterized protein LOC130457269 n=1 Tax=Monodelphis domestica TaxID=13616 RepID=UPI0024E208F5|nr:uncharacterized protein LOC130457269 [Monodelphis domestica]
MYERSWGQPLPQAPLLTLAFLPNNILMLSERHMETPASVILLKRVAASFFLICTALPSPEACPGSRKRSAALGSCPHNRGHAARDPVACLEHGSLGTSQLGGQPRHPSTLPAQPPALDPGP